MTLVTHFYSLIVLFVAIIWACTTFYLWSNKKKSSTYLLFFTVFFIYIFKVLDYTLIEYQSLLLLKHIAPDLILKGQEEGQNLNVIPLLTLGPGDVKTSLLNILLMIPFGFGLPFVTDFRMKKIVIIGALFSIFIELVQLITGFVSEVTFRVADINDVIFNTFGVAVGYVLFLTLLHFYRKYFTTGHINRLL